jgi:hypothetical protein
MRDPQPTPVRERFRSVVGCPPFGFFNLVSLTVAQSRGRCFNTSRKASRISLKKQDHWAFSEQQRVHRCNMKGEYHGNKKCSIENRADICFVVDRMFIKYQGSACYGLGDKRSACYG